MFIVGDPLLILLLLLLLILLIGSMSQENVTMPLGPFIALIKSDADGAPHFPKPLHTLASYTPQQWASLALGDFASGMPFTEVPCVNKAHCPFRLFVVPGVDTNLRGMRLATFLCFDMSTVKTSAMLLFTGTARAALTPTEWRFLLNIYVRVSAELLNEAAAVASGRVPAPRSTAGQPRMNTPHSRGYTDNLIAAPLPILEPMDCFTYLSSDPVLL